MTSLQGNLYLANLIFIFHCGIILFVLFAPFINIPAIFVLHITFCISLFMHWYANSNICGLTILESQLRGLDSADTFSHKFISPIYDISESEWNNILWIITFIVMCISIYKLYHTEKFKNAWNCYMKLEEFTWQKRFECFKSLFVID
jgi:hypothetical protein